MTDNLIRLETIQGLREIRETHYHRGQKVGFVPTMGCLHAGHLSLVEKAKKECDQVYVSIFVNPTQFGEGEDFESYPRTLNEDLQALEGQADYVFLPKASEIYGSNNPISISEKYLSAPLCGRSRPGHFDGVLQVVLKLLHLVQPTKMYMGLKDYQQFRLVDHMCKDLLIASEVIGCPTFREADGLAMSSRNRYLSPSERKLATRLHQRMTEAARELEEIWTCVAKDANRLTSLQSVREKICSKLAGDGFEVDYLNILNERTLTFPEGQTAWKDLRIFGAAYLRETRLIDNLNLSQARAQSIVQGS